MCKHSQHWWDDATYWWMNEWMLMLGVDKNLRCKINDCIHSSVGKCKCWLNNFLFVIKKVMGALPYSNLLCFHVFDVIISIYTRVPQKVLRRGRTDRIGLIHTETSNIKDLFIWLLIIKNFTKKVKVIMFLCFYMSKN